MYEIGLFFLGFLAGFLAKHIFLSKRRLENKGTIFVTPDHLKGLILPTPGSKVLLEDGGEVTIAASVPPNDVRYVLFTGDIRGPSVVGHAQAGSISRCDYIVSASTFWNSVIELNGKTVLRMPIFGGKE
jgi:hypothetical protein